MKKVLIFISAAAILFSACTKVTENVQEYVQPEITFQTATHLTKVDGPVFPTSEKFSVYAWTEASVLPYFMDNVTVAYDGVSAWRTQGSTYYWPKYSTVDFIAYYPTGMSGITVAENKITYSNIDVNALQKDIMYTDKAAGFSNNEHNMSDGVHDYAGVPLIFRHATAKVKFLVELVYDHKVADDGTVTDWEVTVNSMSINSIYDKGSCVLNLKSSPTAGLIEWNRPTDTNGNVVWTPAGSVVNFPGLISNQTLTPGTQYDAVSECYVLPQTLGAGEQKVQMNLTIKTTRNGVLALSETFDREVDIRIANGIEAWEMNNVYTYRLSLTPTASNGNGGRPIDPNNPVDPDDPDLDDVIITFDPAVDGWDNVNVVTVLNI